MQRDCVTGTQPKDDSLEAAVISLTKPNLCVVVHFDDAANLLPVAHQLTRQRKLRILGRAQSESASPLKDLPATHRHQWFVPFGSKNAFQGGEHGRVMQANVNNSATRPAKGMDCNKGAMAGSAGTPLTMS